MLVLFLRYHQVPRRIDEVDRQWWSYYRGYLINKGIDPELEHKVHPPSQSHYRQQLRLISTLQQSVQERSPAAGKEIPTLTNHKLDAVLSEGIGMCYDRAYTLEVLLRQSGFETRHVALYLNNPKRANWKELLTKNQQSHASTEVLTQKGWLIVEPDQPWLGLTTDSLPHCYFENHKMNELEWLQTPPTNTEWHLQNDAIQVYGLYARHGNFSAPFNCIPDVNWWELTYNIGTD